MSPTGGTHAGVRDAVGRVAGLQGGTVVAGPVDEGVDRLAVGGDLRQAQRAVLVGLVPRLADRRRTPLDGLAVHGVDVVDRPGQVVDAVAVLADVGGDGGVAGERRGDDDADRALLEDVGRLVPHARLRARVGGAGEAEHRLEEGGRRAGVADPQLEAVPPEQVGAGRLGGGHGRRSCSCTQQTRTGRLAQVFAPIVTRSAQQSRVDQGANCPTRSRAIGDQVPATDDAVEDERIARRRTPPPTPGRPRR